MIQRVNAGYRPDDWDKAHDCVRDEIVTRIVDLQQTELSNRTTSAFNNDLGCFLRLQDPEGNAYEALRVTQSTNLKYHCLVFHIRLSDELRKRLENDSYYPYTGPSV